MAIIDSRLIDADDELKITENFNRLLAMIDGLESRIEALETPPTSE